MFTSGAKTLNTGTTGRTGGDSLPGLVNRAIVGKVGGCDVGSPTLRPTFNRLHPAKVSAANFLANFAANFRCGGMVFIEFTPP